MRAVIQKTSSSSVRVDDKIVGQIGPGVTILLGVAEHDGPEQALWLANKVANLRIFADDDGLMNLSMQQLGLSALVISQFTLYGDCRKGRRPSFAKAAHPELAEPLYEQFCHALIATGVQSVQRGVFGAMMQVSLVNEGPVTLIIDTP